MEGPFWTSTALLVLRPAWAATRSHCPCLSLGPHLLWPHLCSALHGSVLSLKTGCPSSLWPQSGREGPWSPSLYSVKALVSTPHSQERPPSARLGSGVLLGSSWPWERGVRVVRGSGPPILEGLWGWTSLRGGGLGLGSHGITHRQLPHLLSPTCSLLAWRAVRSRRALS